MCQGQVLWKKPGSYPIELCSPLCSLLVSYAAHSVLRLFSALPGLLWQGHPGSAFERHYNWENWSWSVKPSQHQQFMRRKRPVQGSDACGSDLCEFCVEMNKDHTLKAKYQVTLTTVTPKCFPSDVPLRWNFKGCLYISLLSRRWINIFQQTLTIQHPIIDTGLTKDQKG